MSSTHPDQPDPDRRRARGLSPSRNRPRDARELRDASLTELVQRARADDQEAWAEILDRFSPMVRKRIREVEMSRTLAEDAFQLTWMKLANSLHAIRDPERLPGWLSVTARNEAYNLVRNNWRLICSDSFDERGDPEEADPTAALMGDVTEHAVRGALTSLTERQQAIVRLRYLEAEVSSYAQIAQMLDMRPGAIGPTLGRALDRMGRHPMIAALR